MNKEELIRNLKYEKEKHKNDYVPTFGTDISAMCWDVLEVLKNCIEISEGVTNGGMIVAMFPDYRVEDKGGSIYLHYPDGGWIVFDRDWWNAPYKEGAKE